MSGRERARENESARERERDGGEAPSSCGFEGVSQLEGVSRGRGNRKREQSSPIDDYASTPYILHPTSFNLHPSPYTLHTGRDRWNTLTWRGQGIEYGKFKTVQSIFWHVLAGNSPFNLQGFASSLGSGVLGWATARQSASFQRHVQHSLSLSLTHTHTPETRRRPPAWRGWPRYSTEATWFRV